MDQFKVDFNAEYNHVIGLAAEKFGYDEDLQEVLKKALPAMLEGHSHEEKQLFYKMMSHTPIVVVDEDSPVNKQELERKYFGNINSHIIEGAHEESVYDQLEGDGSFNSEIEFDENANVVARKQYLYIKRANPEKHRNGYIKDRIDLFKTGINVSHLMHELGHAWCSEANPLEYEDGVLKERCGACTTEFTITPNGDGTYTRTRTGVTGLYIEESFNTEMELEALSKYLNMGREATDALFKTGPLIKSNYQGAVSGVANHILTTPLGKDFQNYRLTGDKKYLDKINGAIEKTEAHQRRMDSSNESRGKDQVFLEPASDSIAEFLTRCKNVYYPDKENMTPFEILDNALNQSFDLGINKLKFDVFDDKSFGQYKAISYLALSDAYVPINQARDLILGKDSKSKEEQK